MVVSANSGLPDLTVARSGMASANMLTGEKLLAPETLGWTKTYLAIYHPSFAGRGSCFRVSLTSSNRHHKQPSF